MLGIASLSDLRVNAFLSSVAFHIETSHLICNANQMIGSYMKCNTRLKWVKSAKFTPKKHCRLFSYIPVTFTLQILQVALLRSHLRIPVITFSNELLYLNSEGFIPQWVVPEELISLESFQPMFTLGICNAPTRKFFLF